MRLRQRLELTFLLLLVVPFVAVTILQVDRTINVMVSELELTGKLLIGQIFEHVRTDLQTSQPDPIAALRSDSLLAALLRSSLAFGPAVVYAGLETLDGKTISGLLLKEKRREEFRTCKRRSAQRQTKRPVFRRKKRPWRVS